MLFLKEFFGAKGNEGILKDFLESILEIEIESLILDLNNELLPEFCDGKKTSVDVRTRLSDGTEVNIEMQMDSSKYSDKRCLQHWSKIYSNTLQKGEDYSTLRKSICIWILNGKVYKEFADIDSKWQIMNKKHMLTNHFEELEIYIIELQKLRESDRIKSSKKNFWLWFIDHTNEELVNMACVSNERIKEAREQLDKIRADEQLMEILRLQEKAELDERTLIVNAERKGLASGMAKGMAKAKHETAIKMLELGIDIELIEKSTGLTKEEILKIKEEK